MFQGFHDHPSKATGQPYTQYGGSSKRYSDFFFKKIPGACARPFLCAFLGCSKDYADRQGVLSHARRLHTTWCDSGGAPEAAAMSDQAGGPGRKRLAECEDCGTGEPTYGLPAEVHVLSRLSSLVSRLSSLLSRL